MPAAWSKRARAAGRESYRSVPMPTVWAPWPGKRKALGMMAPCGGRGALSAPGGTTGANGSELYLHLDKIVGRNFEQHRVPRDAGFEQELSAAVEHDGAFWIADA